MTIWDLMTSNKDKDFTVYDTEIDAAPVECINFDYNEEKGDNYYDFLFELYSRVEIDEGPRYNQTTCDAKFYDFVEKNIGIFEKELNLWDNDHAAEVVDYLNNICAGGLSDATYGKLAKDLAELPTPSRSQGER